jgi:hypothetical protein
MTKGGRASSSRGRNRPGLRVTIGRRAPCLEELLIARPAHGRGDRLDLAQVGPTAADVTGRPRGELVMQCAREQPHGRSWSTDRGAASVLVHRFDKPSTRPLLQLLGEK